MTEKLNLSQLLQQKTELKEDGTKKRSIIHEKFLSKMTEEEIKAWRERAKEKRMATWEAKRKKEQELLNKAEQLIPEVLAYELAQEEIQKENWTPKQEMIDKIKMLIKKSDLTFEELRAKYFKQVNDETWSKLKKFVFKSQISQSEDLGAEILRVKRVHIKTVKSRIRMYRKQIKEYKLANNTKMAPVGLLTLLKDSENELIAIELDIAKTLYSVGAVGEKSKAPSLHVHMNIPRPPKQEKVVGEE